MSQYELHYCPHTAYILEPNAGLTHDESVCNDLSLESRSAIEVCLVEKKDITKLRVVQT